MSKSLVQQFLDYCQHNAHGEPRAVPLNPRTLERYERGLKHVEKVIGKKLTKSLTDKDQVLFMERIQVFSQGTRRVDTQIFQRFVAWGIKHFHLKCQNMIVGKEHLIIGEHTPTEYIYLSQDEVRRFFHKLDNDDWYMMFGMMYFGGLTLAELAYVEKDKIRDDGIIVYRLQRKETLLVAVPSAFLKELRVYAADKEGKLFPQVNDTRQSRHDLNLWFKQAQSHTQELLGASLRDLRVSGIRHVYNLTQDLDGTIEYAGADPKKSKWVEALVMRSSYTRLKNAAQLRRYHGRKENN